MLTDPDWKQVRDEMQVRIWEFIDGMRAGQFQVEPSAPEEPYQNGGAKTMRMVPTAERAKVETGLRVGQTAIAGCGCRPYGARFPRSGAHQ